MYNPSSTRWRHRRRRILGDCLAVLNGITAGAHYLCVQQYTAEVLTDLARLGDRHAAAAARQIFDSIIAEFPWFTPAYAQACHLMLDQKRLDEARHYLRQGEDRDCMQPQVKEARNRILDLVRR
jgi:hypothetical protein